VNLYAVTIIATTPIVPVGIISKRYYQVTNVYLRDTIRVVVPRVCALIILVYNTSSLIYIITYMLLAEFNAIIVLLCFTIACLLRYNY
jgi:hypothetical protein